MTFPEFNVSSVLNRVVEETGQVILAKLVAAAAAVALKMKPTVATTPPLL
jgi:hypothetical protein